MKKSIRFTPNRVLRAVGVLVLLLGLGYLGIGRGARFQSAPGHEDPAVTSARSQSQLNAHPQSREVSSQVELRNRSEETHIEKLTASGWKPIESEPPRLEIVELQPDFLERFKRDIQVQLQTVTLTSSTLLKNASAIALRAPDEKTTELAIEALGRSPLKEAQGFLCDLFGKFREEARRRQILGWLHPTDWEDESAKFLVKVLEDPKIEEDLQSQAAHALAAMALARADARSVREVPESVLTKIPTGWRDRFREIWKTVSSGGT